MTRFQADFAPTVEIQQLARDFLDMRHTIESVVKVTTKFRERPLLVPQYAGDEEMKKTRYHDMLRADIRKYVSYLAHWTLDDMIARARDKEIDIEHIRRGRQRLGKRLGFRGRNPRDSTLGRRASRVRVALGNAARRMREYAD